MSFNNLLNKTCTVQTKTKVQGNTGSVTNTWADSYEDVAVRYERAKEGSIISGLYQVTLDTSIFYFKSDQIITKADRIVIDSKTFEVEHVFKDSSGHHLEVYGKERTYN